MGGQQPQKTSYPQGAKENLQIYLIVGSDLQRKLCLTQPVLPLPFLPLPLPQGPQSPSQAYPAGLSFFFFLKKWVW